MFKFVRLINALVPLALMLIIFGAYVFEYVLDEEPCPLCRLQRLGMIAVALAYALNLRFGIRPRHYGLALFAAIFGGFAAGRQVSLHICPSFTKWGSPLWGLNLYTWSFVTFLGVGLVTALLLCFYEPRQAEVRRLSWLDCIACGLILIVAAANTATTLFDCGWGPCEG